VTSCETPRNFSVNLSRPDFDPAAPPNWTSRRERALRPTADAWPSAGCRRKLRPISRTQGRDKARAPPVFFHYRVTLRAHRVRDPGERDDERQRHRSTHVNHLRLVDRRSVNERLERTRDSRPRDVPQSSIVDLMTSPGSAAGPARRVPRSPPRRPAGAAP